MRLVDHRERAERMLRDIGIPSTVDAMLGVVRIHALLAIADELHRLNDRRDDSGDGDA